MKIPIKVYEELDFNHPLVKQVPFMYKKKWQIEWCDNYGINTPYLVTWVNTTKRPTGGEHNQGQKAWL